MKPPDGAQAATGHLAAVGSVQARHSIRLPALLAPCCRQVDRMVSATLAAVDAGLAAHGPRLVMFSSFDPEVCAEIKRRCAGRGSSCEGLLGLQRWLQRTSWVEVGGCKQAQGRQAAVRADA